MTVETERSGGLWTVAINRPEARNALDLATIRALRAAIESAGREARCLVLTGRGKAFSAGADVKEWSDARAKGIVLPWVEEMHALVREMAAVPVPTIAALNGVAVGAGLDLALACDFRIASEDASFRCAYTRLAYPPDAGGTWLLPRILGLEQAKRFVFTGDAWPAAEALARGLVSDVHSAAGFEAAVDAFAKKLAGGPTVALRHAKRLIETASARDLREQLEAERAAGKACGETADHDEAMCAIGERRAPVFQGR